ncbi:hypothetical protein SH661x_001919 [Planctomicrobium sp. SH661]|uniref:hypothetical protein n=1 Tax=Planctomicrobium sp. SH661 TaxID=3448124 RepID=UPI003F5AE17E
MTWIDGVLCFVVVGLVIDRICLEGRLAWKHLDPDDHYGRWGHKPESPDDE